MVSQGQSLQWGLCFLLSRERWYLSFPAFAFQLSVQLWIAFAFWFLHHLNRGRDFGSKVS